MSAKAVSPTTRGKEMLRSMRSGRPTSPEGLARKIRPVKTNLREVRWASSPVTWCSANGSKRITCANLRSGGKTVDETRPFRSLRGFECNDSITVSAPVPRVDFDGANQPKLGEKGAEHVDYRFSLNV